MSGNGQPTMVNVMVPCTFSSAKAVRSSSKTTIRNRHANGVPICLLQIELTSSLVIRTTLIKHRCTINLFHQHQSHHRVSLLSRTQRQIKRQKNIKNKAPILTLHINIGAYKFILSYVVQLSSFGALISYYQTCA